MGNRIVEYSHDELREKIFDIARKIHRKKREQVISIECDGKINKFPVGEDGISEMDSDKVKMAVIVLHNHPHEFNYPSTFSGLDVFNLLYYRINEIIVCSYGKYYIMSNNGCKLLGREVKNILDTEYLNIDKRLREKYINIAAKNPDMIKSGYRDYKINLEIEYNKFLKKFAKENNLKYLEGEL